MLTKSAIAAAAPLAQLFANRNICLEPAQGSSLGILTRPLVAPLAAVAETGAEGGLNEFAEALHEASQASEDGVNFEHDSTMQHLQQQVVNVLRFNLQLARGQVTEQITELVTGLDELSREVEDATINRLKIVPSPLTPATESGMFDEIAQRYAETRAADLKLSIVIPQPEDVLSYVSTGTMAYDSALQETVDERGGEDYVRGIWDRLFVRGASRLEELFPLTDPHQWADLSIAFVIVKNVQVNLPANINAPLEQVQDYLSQLSSQLGRMIAVAARRRQLNQRSQRVILATPQGHQGEVMVNSDVYNQYLDDGGTPEAVLGAVASNEALSSASDLIQDKSRLERQWAAARRIQQETVAANRFSAAVDHLRMHIGRLIADLPEDQVSELYQGDRSVVYGRLEQYLMTLNISLLDDTWNQVRRVLCGVLYPHTAVEVILQGIDREAAHMPDGDVNEAATLAVVDYFVEWMALQIVKLKAG